MSVLWMYEGVGDRGLVAQYPYLAIVLHASKQAMLQIEP